MASQKHPWFKAWAKDILGDKDFATISLAGKGYWLNLLCLMHLSPRKGYLLQENGTPYSMETLARISGISPDEAAHLYQCLLTSGIFSVSDTEPKVPFSRRMVREARITQVRAEAGSKGGRFAQAKLKQTSSKAPSNSLEYGMCLDSSNSKEEKKNIPIPPDGMGVQGEGKFAQAKIEQNKLSLESLAVAWVDRRGANSSLREYDKAVEGFSELYLLGVPLELIRDEVMRADRSAVSDAVFDVVKRLRAAKAGGKTAVDEDRLERLKKKGLIHDGD